MRIGLVVGLSEFSDGTPPRWSEIEAIVLAAEQVGFDIVVFEDALTFEGRGRWESMAMAGAMAAVTKTIDLSHSVVNAQLRLPAVIARAAEALDEISGGRYQLGIGAGNTPEDFADYAIAVDHKFSRFEEALAIVHALLKEGSVDFDGRFHTAHRAGFAPRGPRPGGPPIIVAGKGERVLGMCARYADGWNWWGSAADPQAGVGEIIKALDAACQRHERDPATLQRSLDLYSYDILGTLGDDRPDWVFGGHPEQIAESILGLADFGVDEVRCDLAARPGQRVAAAEAMAPVVELVHAANRVPGRD